MASEDWGSVSSLVQSGEDWSKVSSPFNEQEKPKPESAVGAILRQGLAGTKVELPKMLGQALQYTGDPGDARYALGKEIANAAEARGKLPENAPIDESQHNWLTNALAGGARMIPQSLAPAAAIGAAAAAVPASVTAAIPAGALLLGGAALSSLPTAMSQGQETLDKGLAAGVSPEESLKAARLNALIEGGGETLGTAAMGKVFGLGSKVLTKAKTPGDVLKNAVDPAIVKPWAKSVAQAYPTEILTEMGQNAGETAVENAYGIDKKNTPWEAAKEAVAPTFGMTTILAPFGLAGHAANSMQAKAAAKTLSSSEAPADDRASVAMNLYNEMKGVDKEAADVFKDNAIRAISNRRAFTLDETALAPYDATAETAQMNALNADLGGAQFNYENTIPSEQLALPPGVITVPNNAGGETVVDSNNGPISSAAVTAVTNSTLAEDVASGMPLKGYSPEQAKEELASRPDADRYEIKPHPVSGDRGRVAIVPKSAQALAEIDAKASAGNEAMARNEQLAAEEDSRKQSIQTAKDVQSLQKQVIDMHRSAAAIEKSITPNTSPQDVAIAREQAADLRSQAKTLNEQIKEIANAPQVATDGGQGSGGIAGGSTGNTQAVGGVDGGRGGSAGSSVSGRGADLAMGDASVSDAALSNADPDIVQRRANNYYTTANSILNEGGNQEEAMALFEKADTLQRQADALRNKDPQTELASPQSQPMSSMPAMQVIAQQRAQQATQQADVRAQQLAQEEGTVAEPAPPTVKVPRPMKVGGLRAAKYSDEQLQDVVDNANVPATSRRAAAAEIAWRQAESEAAAQTEIAQSTGKMSRQRAGESPADYQYRMAAEKNAAKAQRQQQPQTATEAEDIAAVRRAIKDPKAEVSVVSEESMPDMDKAAPRQVSKQTATFLRHVAKTFGKEIVFVDGMESDGFYQSGNKIYLSNKSSVHHVRVLGHEMLHAMKRQNRASYDKLLKAVSEIATDTQLTGQFKDYFAMDAKMNQKTDAEIAEWLTDPASREMILEEMMADLSGNRWAESSFWESVFTKIDAKYGSEQAKGIIAKLRLALVNALNKLMSLVKGGQFKVDARVAEHLESIREALATGFADYAKAVKDKQVSEDGPSRVKFSRLPSRWPTSKKATPSVDDNMLADLATLRETPDLLEKSLNAITEEPGMKTRAKTIESRLESVIKKMVDNLLWLHDQVPENIRQRSKLWYDGANVIATNWAKKYDKSVSQTSGILAVLSPQKDWFMNVTMGERILDVLSSKMDHKFDSKMKASAFQFLLKDQQKPEEKRANTAAFNRVKNMTLKEAIATNNMLDIGVWLRSYDEAHHAAQHAVIHPEGDFGGNAKTVGGTDTLRAWGGFDALGKAASIFMDGSAENINAKLGGEHKVRNFYNNIFNPKDKNFTTIDTHAVAADMLRPLAGVDKPVSDNFGQSGGSAITGVSGTYPIHFEAYKRAAEARGVLPREMQSITWEAVRGLFTEGFKGKKENLKAIDDIWLQVDAGKLSIDDARNKILDMAGGIEHPDWWDGKEPEIVGNEKSYAQTRPGFKGVKVTFEVAPDPNDKARTKRWNSLKQEDKDAISYDMAWDTAAKVLAYYNSDTIKGELHTQVGGYLENTNPSFSLWMNKYASMVKVKEIARSLGYVLKQDSMVIGSSKKFKGGSEMGVVVIRGVSDDQAKAVYDEVRGKVPGIEGHTTAENDMMILVDLGKQTEIAKEVANYFDGRHDVYDDTTFVEWPERGENEYGLLGQQEDNGTESESPLRGFLRELRTATEKEFDSRVSAAKSGIKLSPARSDAAGDERAGGLAASGVGEVPNYGTASTGSVKATGIHYSGSERSNLDGRYYGTGSKGRESDRVLSAQDKRLRERIYFYVDSGKGITPEQGVGSIPHSVNLNNLYDGNADTFVQENVSRELKGNDWMSAFESAVIDAGFDGYISDFGAQRAVVLIGRHNVPVVAGKSTVASPRNPQAQSKRTDLPMGKMTGAEWKKLEPRATDLEDGKMYYRDDIKFSPARKLDKESTDESLPQVWYRGQIGASAEKGPFDATALGAPSFADSAEIASEYAMNPEAAGLYGFGSRPSGYSDNGNVAPYRITGKIFDARSLQGGQGTQTGLVPSAVNKILKELGLNDEDVMLDYAGKYGRGSDAFWDSAEYDLPDSRKILAAYTLFDQPEVQEALRNKGYAGAVFNGAMSTTTPSDSSVPWPESKVHGELRAVMPGSLSSSISPDIRYSPPRWYFSPLEKAFDSAPDKVFGQAAQVKLWLAGNKSKLGLKDDEIFWTGINDWLDMQGKQKVSKADVLGYLAGNGVQVEEVMKGVPGYNEDDPQIPAGSGMRVIEATDGVEGYEVLAKNGRVIGVGKTKADAIADAYSGNPEYWEGAEATKFDRPDLVLPGGESYRELLLTLPPKGAPIAQRPSDGLRKPEQIYADPTYRSSHWEEPNILAHIRMNDRTDANGNKVLFIEEVQSDFGQSGEDVGFVGQKPMDEKLLADKKDQLSKESNSEKASALKKSISKIENRINKNNYSIPSAPFVTDTKAWLGLSIKRIMAYAAANGYDKVAFINGEQSADRYRLDKHIKRVEADLLQDGRYYVVGIPFDEGAGRIGEGSFSKEELPNLLGEEVAAKVIDRAVTQGKTVRLNNLDLKVGGTGMKAFYDRIVPQVVSDQLKKVGGKMETVGIATGKINVFQIDEDAWGNNQTDNAYSTKAEAEAAAATQQPGFTVTPKMSEPLPLFSPRRQTETPEFKAWFGDSKVVDADGKPLVVYHGTVNNFDSFRTSTELGAHFGPIEQTESFTSGLDASVLPVYLSIKNPLRLTDFGGFDGNYVAPQLRDLELIDDATLERLVAAGFSKEATREMQNVIRSAGYDGIVYLNRREGQDFFGPDGFTGDEIYDMTDEELLTEFPEAKDSYIAFDTTQIKSAIGNNGQFDPANPDIRRSPARSAATGNPLKASWESTEVTQFDNVIRQLADKLIDTKRVVQAIKDAGIAISDEIDPYLKEILYHGRAMKFTQNFNEQELRPLLNAMQIRKITRQEIEDYLWAQHAPERNAQNAKAGIQDGSGLTDGEARDILAGRTVTKNGRTIQLNAAKMQDYRDMSAKVKAINDKTLDELVAYGLETRATVDQWKRTYQNYVPLMRDMSDDNYAGANNRGLGTGKGFSVRGSASKRAIGSQRGVIDIMANIAMQRERAITRGEKNKVSQATYGLALAAPNPDFWLPIDPAANRNPAAIAKLQQDLIKLGMNPIDAQNVAQEPVQTYIHPKTGKAETRINPALRNRDNVLAVRINGEDKFIFFSSNDRAKAMVTNLKNLDDDQLGGFLQASAKITRWFASVNTQYNPVFGMVNGIRDFGGAMLNLTSTPLAGQQARVAKYGWDALRGIYSDLRDHRAGRKPSSAWAQEFEEFASNGGQTGYRDMFNTAEDRTKALQKELERMASGDVKKWTSIGENHPVFAWLSDYNTAIENAFRLAAYKVAKENGMTQARAAQLAKNLTVNFNKKGLAATQTGALYAFFNAAVQGTARIGETLLQHNGNPSDYKNIRLSSMGKKIVLGGITLGVMQALLGAMAGWDDDEPKQFQRERNLIIPIPGSDKYISIPLPLGFHVLPNLGRITTEFMLSGFKNPGKRLTDLLGVMAEAFNPIGNAGMSLQTIAPTFADPLVALATNKDWNGQSIAREDFNRNKPTPGWSRTKDTATPWGKSLAYALNYVSGGGEYGKGMISPTPDQIDYLIGQAFGGVGREISKLATSAKTVTTGEELPMYKVPIAGRFIGETTGVGPESGRFYDNLEKIGAHDFPLKKMKEERDLAGLRDYLNENPEAKLIKMADKAQRDISDLRMRKRKTDDPERVKSIESMISLRMKSFNNQVRNLQERSG